MASTRMQLHGVLKSRDSWQQHHQHMEEEQTQKGCCAQESDACDLANAVCRTRSLQQRRVVDRRSQLSYAVPSALHRRCRIVSTATILSQDPPEPVQQCHTSFSPNHSFKSYYQANPTQARSEYSQPWHHINSSLSASLARSWEIYLLCWSRLNNSKILRSLQRRSNHLARAIGRWHQLYCHANDRDAEIQYGYGSSAAHASHLIYTMESGHSHKSLLALNITSLQRASNAAATVSAMHSSPPISTPHQHGQLIRIPSIYEAASTTSGPHRHIVCRNFDHKRIVMKTSVLITLVWSQWPRRKIPQSLLLASSSI